VRRLIHVPIIHSLEDFGSQQEAVRRAYVSRYGIRAWQQHLEGVKQFWKDVRRAAPPLARTAATLRIYQDGLPACGREAELVRELAAQGSENHRLLLALAERGAVLMGTEDPDLLRQEHERSRRLDVRPEVAAGARYDELMERRDRYIAARIDATLKEEPETGLLFMGALHRVVEGLPNDIGVTRLPGCGPG
jgi:hypothetical protein